MHHAIRTLPKFLSDLILLGKELHVFESSSHPLLLRLHAGLGWGVGRATSLTTDLALDEGMVSAEEREGLEFGLDAVDVGATGDIALYLHQWGVDLIHLITVIGSPTNER